MDFMDNDRNYIPPGDKNARSGSGYGRKIPESPSGYDREQEKRQFDKKRSEEKKKREAQRRKQTAKRKAARIRVILAAAAVVLLAVIVLFFTPLMNIQTVSCTGNSIVKSSDIEEKMSGAVGKNIIFFSDNDAKDMLSDLSYIENVSVAKFLIPPGIKLNVKECTPAARVELNGRNVIIDPQLKILSDGGDFNGDELPVIEGLPVSRYRVGEKLTTADNDSERLEILAICLDTMSKLNMINKLDYINVENKADIRFGYEDRIDALCGGNVDLDHKIRMFNAVVTGNDLSEDAQGTIDLSVSGNAVYTS